MAVRILNISGITAPEGLACGLHEPRASFRPLWRSRNATASGSNDAFRFQPQAVAVEAHSRFQIVDADCQYADSWSHVMAFKIR
ncbi:hypothetical protein WM18_00350 [Burkholderia ubonensis]|nr:hypothetical protein WL17_24980 [Burkholderia ubonensis]KWK81404.1 hypothetical protein WM17_19250 [Burkholderia ubonensis]KWK96631.1 hypothetical protein WM18_00350 [Burkholderia ubonensis]